jgi:superfamily II DNA or RNA helicase
MTTTNENLMKTLNVQIGPTRVVIDFSKVEGHEKHFVEYHLKEFCKTKLTTIKQDRRSKQWIKDREYFIVEKGVSYTLPQTFYKAFKERLNENRPDCKFHETLLPTTSRDITFNINPSWKDKDYQIPAINFLSESATQTRGLELRTGDGKTYCSIKSMWRMGHVTMIVVNGLVDQWVKEVAKITDMDLDDPRLYQIQGFDSLDKLFKSDLRPEVFVCSLGTMRKFRNHEGNYENLPTYGEFVKEYKIGTRIVDEAHQCFHATTMMDLSGDVNINIYLTATFLTADAMLKRLFAAYFPNQMRYDGGVRNKYTDMYSYLYPGIIPTRKTMFMGQYSHGRFEKLMLWNKRKLFNRYVENLLIKLIVKHFIPIQREGKKLLIFCYLKNTAVEFQKRLKVRFPDMNVVTYLSHDPESHLTDGDIIISTPKGAGTGKDIKGLTTVINTVSYGAETLARQLFGRLREIPDFITEYIEIVDTNNTVQRRHMYTRKGHLRRFARRIFEDHIWW